MISNEEFEKLVHDAILELPEGIRAKMDNVAVVVEEEPRPDQLQKNGIRKGDLLLGLYEGTPRSKRGPSYTLVLPDKITIFKNAIEAVAASPADIKRQVAETMRHEIAHHFGFDEPGAQRVARNRRS